MEQMGSYSERYIHNIWCTSDINKSVPAGSLFSSTPEVFLGENQDFCILCLFSFLKWFRHINSCNAFPRSATKSKMPVKVVHYTSNLFICGECIQSWIQPDIAVDASVSFWSQIATAKGGGSSMCPVSYLLILCRVSHNLRLPKYIHAWAAHWTGRAGVSCTLQTCI